MNKIDELKKYELIVLDEFVRICKKYKLTYYLAFGSALGAIRHKGFIPWDDDIDIQMPISDLLKFKEVCKRELTNEFYFQDKLNDKYYYNFWPKLGLENTTWMPKDHLINCKYGVCIDIFPLFPVKNGNEKKEELYIKLMYISCSKYYVLNTKKEKYKLYKKIIHFLLPNFVSNKLFTYSIKKLSSDSDNYDKLVLADTTTNKNYYYDKEVFLGNKTLEFEKRKLSVPNNINEYLTLLYGNYMELPPEDKRYGHDTGDDIIYDFKNSYKKYLGDKNDKS